MITCAIQIGSSRILGIAATKDPSGRPTAIHIESESAQDCISHGCIVNIEQTAMHLRSIVQKLSNRISATITSAYVGIGGISLHSLVQQPSVQLPEHDVLATDAIPNQQYQLTIALKHLRQRTIAAMERASINVVEIFANPQATATILTNNDLSQGCVLVDMGASTTTVQIFKDGYLRHLAVIPLGGDAVTADIQTVCSSVQQAESLKHDWSDVAQEVTSESRTSHVASLFDDKTLPIPIAKLNTIALCRYEEIAANIQHQIDLTGLQDQLEAGCILTGGAAVQNGLTTLLRRCLSVPRIETRAYYERAMLGSERKPHLTNILGLLSFCTADCTKPAAPAPTPVTPKRQSAATNTQPTLPDGQITIDMPTDEPEETNPERKENSSTLRKAASRFLRDLITGQ